MDYWVFVLDRCQYCKPHSIKQRLNSQENKKLQRLNLKKVAEHVAITQGDGLGYDIKSYDENGNEIYIEVKTTTQNFGTSFYHY